METEQSHASMTVQTKNPEYYNILNASNQILDRDKPYFQSFFSMLIINDTKISFSISMIFWPFSTDAFFGAPVAPVSVNSLNFQYIRMSSLGKFGITCSGA